MGIVAVDAHSTTRECSRCGNIQDMQLSERTYTCRRCGTKIDRDINASINILKRATAGHAGSHARGDSVRLQREAVAVEPRTYPEAIREAHGFSRGRMSPKGI